MKKPILFIHETPFIRDNPDQKLAYNLLRTRLEKFGGIELIEFAWADYSDDWEMPVKDSPEFCEWVSGRKMVFVHNSIPDSTDPNPLFPEAYIPRLRELVRPANLIRFSGNAGQKPDAEGNKAKLKVIVEDLRFYRKDVYDHLDIFIRHWKATGLEVPFFHLIQDGQKAFVYHAQDLKLEIRMQLFERNNNLVSVLSGAKEYIPKPVWRSRIGDNPLLELLRLTGKSQEWIEAALTKLEQKKASYQNPEGYLIDLESIIEKSIKTRMAI